MLRDNAYCDDKVVPEMINLMMILNFSSVDRPDGHGNPMSENRPEKLSSMTQQQRKLMIHQQIRALNENDCLGVMKNGLPMIRPLISHSLLIHQLRLHQVIAHVTRSEEHTSELQSQST